MRKLKVGQLLQELSQYPPEMDVVINGSELMIQNPEEYVEYEEIKEENS